MPRSNKTWMASRKGDLDRDPDPRLEAIDIVILVTAAATAGTGVVEDTLATRGVWKDLPGVDTPPADRC